MIPLRNLLPAHPHTRRLRNRKPRLLRPVRPSRAAELWYRGELLKIVRVLSKETEAAILPMLQARMPRAADMAMDEMSSAEAAVIEQQINALARRFGGIDLVAQRLAALAVQKSQGEVDDRLKASIKSSLKIDISGLLRTAGPLKTEMDKALAANIGLIKSIPEQYFEKVGKAVRDGFEAGKRYETLAEDIEHVGEVTESRAKLIARDQTSKMNGNFNKARQSSLGIEEYVWQTAGDERVRETHADNDGQTFRWDDPPEETGHPGEDVNCFPASEKVQFADGVVKAYRRWFDGELAEIVTDSGKSLRATPNHPVLTPGGWRAIGSLNEGDYVIEIADEAFEIAEEDENDRVPTIGEVFAAVEEGGVGKTFHVRPAEFHGDGTGGDVDVVFAARALRFDLKTCSGKGSGKLALTGADDARLDLGPLDKLVIMATLAAHGIVGLLGKAAAILGAQSLHPQGVRLAGAAQGYASALQTVGYDDAFKAGALGDRKDALAALVGGNERPRVNGKEIVRSAARAPVGRHADSPEFLAQNVRVDAEGRGHFVEGAPFIQKASRVRSVNRFPFAGHVYNLETRDGWYVCGEILTHNCRCVAIPVFNLDEDEE